MQNDMDDLLDAVDRVADTSFDVGDTDERGAGESKTFGANRIARRPSGSAIKGFYRAGERDKDGAPFEVLPTKCPEYCRPPSGHDPTEAETRVAWPLQNEYLADRLGKDSVENSKLWGTVKWIDKIYRTAAMPKNAVRAPSIMIAPDDFSAKEIEDYAVKNEVPAVAFDVLRTMEKMEEYDEMIEIDVNKLLRDAGPRPLRADLPDLYERVAANKIIRMLRLGLRNLWLPVMLAIVDHTEMYRLGITQGARRDIAPAVGRQRVIEGLRIADSIRKGITRSEKRDAVDEASHWPARLAQQRHVAFMDKLINEVLVAIADKPLPANDNYRADTVACIAA